MKRIEQIRFLRVCLRPDLFVVCGKTSMPASDWQLCRWTQGRMEELTCSTGSSPQLLFAFAPKDESFTERLNENKAVLSASAKTSTVQIILCIFSTVWFVNLSTKVVKST